MINFKKNLYGASIIALAFSFSSQALAQTCSTPPDCKTLGFTKTAADCSGKTILKCPFNQAQVYCPGSEEYSRTYNVGDSYLASGIVVGKVYKVDSTKMHGTIVLSASKYGTKADALNYCNSLSLGGMIWNLPTSKDMHAICNSKAVTLIDAVEYWVSDKGYTILSGCSNYNFSDDSGTNSYYCVAEFQHDNFVIVMLSGAKLRSEQACLPVALHPVEY